MEEFQYLYGINGGEQLYFESNTWYQTRPNYWKCTDCNARLSTKGTMHVDMCLKDPSKPLPQHRGHNPVSTDEFKIRRHFWHIKQRITNELELWPSTIFDQEIKKFQIEQKVSKLDIANYVKPYSHYKSGFESRRGSPSYHTTTGLEHNKR